MSSLRTGRSLQRLIDNLGVARILRLVLALCFFLTPAIVAISFRRALWSPLVLVFVGVVLPRLSLGFFIARQPQSFRWCKRICWIGFAIFFSSMPLFALPNHWVPMTVGWIGMSMIFFGIGATGWFFSDHRVMTDRAANAIGLGTVVKDLAAKMIQKDNISEDEKEFCLSALDTHHERAFAASNQGAGIGFLNDFDFVLYFNIIFDAIAQQARAEWDDVLAEEMVGLGMRLASSAERVQLAAIEESR